MDVLGGPDSFDMMVGDAGKPGVTSTTPGFLKTAEQRIAAGEAPSVGGSLPPGAPPPPSGLPGNIMPPDVPLPPNIPTMSPKSLALGALHIVTDIPRSLMTISGIPAFRQGAPLMADAVIRGAPQEIPLAFARSLTSVFRTDAGFSKVTEGFKTVIRDTGAPDWAAKGVISDPLGPLTAREEFGLHSIMDRAPIIGRLNRMHPTFLNSLRTGAFTALADMNKISGKKSSWEDIVGHVREWSGRSDLPGNPETQSLMSGVFFGPQLNKSTWDASAATIGSVLRIVQAVPESLPGFLKGEGVISKATITPVELANVRVAASFVATGVGLMKMANNFGMQVGVNPTKTDFGRMTLPDGTRIDLWGPFNENARLIARSIEFVNDVREGKPLDYKQNNVYDFVTNFLRSKLNAGFPQFIGDVAAGETQAGIPTREAYTSPDFNVNPAIPMPMDVGSVINAMDLPYPGKTKPTGGKGGGLGIAESVLSSLGGTVINQPAKITYDGLGRAESSPDFGTDPILDEYTKLNPDKTLSAPDSTLGSGHNKFPLPVGQREAYVQAIGEQRRIDLGNLIYSEKYQNETKAQREKDFSQTMAKADATANKAFLKNLLPDITDPEAVRAAAVTGLHAQTSAKDEAYWIATLDKAGKLTPDVKQALEDSRVTLPGQSAPMSVDDDLKYAPLIHEYLGHVPFGTDKSPIGTPADWTAVAEAIKAKNQRAQDMVRSGSVSPSLADARAQQEILKTMTSLVQRNLFLNGTQLENPARKLLATKYPTLKHYVSDPKAPKDDTSY